MSDLGERRDESAHGIEFGTSSAPAGSLSDASTSAQRRAPGGTTTRTTQWKPLPQEIPAGAFFVLSPENATALPGKESGPPTLPPVCDWRFNDMGVAGRRRMEKVYRKPTDPADSVPEGTVLQTITTYYGNGAEGFMRELAAAVERCPQEPNPGGRGFTRYRLLDPPDRGDEALLIERKIDIFDPVDQPAGAIVSYTAAVRVGTTVTILFDEGWERWSTNREIVDGFAEQAVTTMRRWIAAAPR